MTQQEFFNITALHLIQQGRQAKGQAFCLYRGPNGTKCAIGAHIPDELYLPEMEASNSNEAWSAIKVLKHIGYTETVFGLGEELQGIHDDDEAWTSPETLKGRLARLANRRNLSTEVLQ